MISQVKIIEHSTIYHKKKGKQIDHLILLADKFKYDQENTYPSQH